MVLLVISTYVLTVNNPQVRSINSLIHSSQSLMNKEHTHTHTAPADVNTHYSAHALVLIIHVTVIIPMERLS